MPIRYLIYGCFSLFLAGPSGLTQNHNDSILKQANKLIYEDPDAAIILALDAYNQPETSVEDKVNFLLSISTSYTSKRDYENSLIYVLKIEDLLPSIKNTIQKMNVLNRIGAQYQDLKIYDKSIDYLDESLDLIQHYPDQDSVQTFLGYNAILRGFIYREQMSCDIALKYFDKAIEAYKNTLQNPMMNANVSICYYNQGNCLLALDKVNEAESSYLKSIAYAEKVEAASLIAFAQKGLAEVKTREGNYQTSISVLLHALSNSESVGDLVLNRGLYYGLYNNYIALKDWKNYAVYRDKYLALQRETKLSERKTINQSLLKITQVKSEEIDQLHHQNTPIDIALILGILFAISLLISEIIRSEKRLKKLEKELKR